MTVRRGDCHRGASCLMLGAFLLSMLLLPQGAAGQTKKRRNLISIQLGGAMGWLSNGTRDLETLRQNMTDYYNALGQLSGYSTSIDWKAVKQIPQFDIDLLLHTSRFVAIGVGTCYLTANSRGTYSYGYHEAGTLAAESYDASQNTVTTRDYHIYAYPVKVSLYGILPLGRTFNLYARTSGGYYFGRVGRDSTERTSLLMQHFPLDTAIPITKEETSLETHVVEDNRQESFGLEGGVGLELKLGSWLSLGVEFFGRSLSFSSLQGDRTDTFTTRQRLYREGAGWYSDQTTSDYVRPLGPLVYYETWDPKLRRYYPEMDVVGLAPSGEGFRNVRYPVVDLSTYGLKVSARFYFTID